MSCSLLQCSITNSCSSLRSFSPHSHPWNHCYALLNQLRISYKSAINQIWAIGYSRHFLWGPIEKQLQEFALQCSQAFLDVALELLCGYLSGWSLSTSHLHSPSTRCIQMSKYHGFTLCKNMQACDLQLCSLYYYTIHVLLSEFSQSRCIHLWGTSNRVFIDGVEPQQVQVRQLWAGPNIWMRIAMSRWRTIAHDKTMCKIRTEPLKAVLVHRLHLTEQGVGTQQKLWRSTQEVWKVESTGCCHNLRPVHCRGLRSQRKGR